MERLGNYYVTPNGDGINDRLVFEDLAEFPENELSLFSRSGQKVFEQKNYTNEFQGFGNTSSLYLKRSAGLPSGVYFYIINTKNPNQEFQGFIYLNR